MHVAAKISIGVGLVAGAGLLLAACSSEKSPNEAMLDEFGKFDDKPKDNNWTRNEIDKSWIHTRTQEVNTYRLGDHVYGTRQILQWESTDSMRRVFDAAKGNDAVLSLQELTNFALRQADADGNGTLNRSERNDFERAYGVTTTKSRTEVIGSEPFVRYSPVYDDYPSSGGGYGGGTSPGDDGGYGGGYGGGTSPGDDGGYGGGYDPGYGGGTSPGDSGGYTPPSSGGGTSPGDGGGYTPPSSGGGTSSGDSTDNGNPSADDF